LLAFAGSTKRTKRKRYHKQSWSLWREAPRKTWQG
jgi:hypothetical protein